MNGFTPPATPDCTPDMPLDDLPDFLRSDTPPVDGADDPVAPNPILDGLTEPQREAVLCTEGPLLILAAAGSGKTRVITRRIAHLVDQGVPPWSILALTFTNKAATEMRERVTLQIAGPNALDPDAPRDPRMRGLTITTFHSLCARLLRRYAEQAEIPGLKGDYTIYDSSDQMTAMKRVLKSMNLQASNWPPRSVLSAISTAKNDMIDAKTYEANAGDFYSKQLAKIYSTYSAVLRKANAIDFDDLLLYTVQILEKHDDIRAELSRRWKYMMIDEYQDTNTAQFKIASLLASAPQPLPGMEDEPTAPNICVVGDPDQAIYGWRGADIGNILDFEEHYPGAKTITLGENFRSTAPILNAADTLIKKNTKRKDKPLFTSTPGGSAIQIVTVNDERHEGETIADWFQQLHDSEHKVAWKDMAVFYRTNALSRVVEDAMRQAGIPYRIARGTAFFDREEIKNTIAYLRTIANPSDNVSLMRIINTPTRGIGKTSLDIIQNASAHAGITLWEGFTRTSELGLTARATSAIGKFVEMVNNWTGEGSFMGASVATSLHELVERVITESGIEAYYKKQAKASGSEADESRLDNLSELISSARDFEREFDPADDPASFTDTESAEQGDIGTVPPLLAMLRAYLESIALVADADAVDPQQGAVTLMTLHASKGLEFPAVAMIALEEGTLPHSRAHESLAELEEERRLAFVGITRAMQHLHITSAKRRTVRGMTERTISSRFLEEIGHDSIIRSDMSNEYSYYEDDGDDIRSTRESTTVSGPQFKDASSTRAKIDAAREQRLENKAAHHNAVSEFPTGCSVRHPQFGVGTIIKVTAGANARAIVHFESVGKKTLVLEYARLKRV